MILWPRPWTRRAKRMRPQPDLPSGARHPLSLRGEVPARAVDTNAEFYRQAIDIAWGIRSRMLVAYHVTIIVFVAAVLVALAAIAWQASDRRIPVHDVAVDLRTPVIAPGDVIRVSYDFIRDKVCPIDISAIVIDGDGELWPLVTVHRDVPGPLGPDHFVRAWQSPPKAAPGRAKLRVGWAWACPGNYFQALSPLPMALQDLEFTLRPAADGQRSSTPGSTSPPGP